MNKILSFVFLSMLTVTAQHSIAQEKKVIPPSPTAAALGKYGDMPVSLYTGTPTINIPLYEIKTGDLMLPVSLNYHASGVRVEEEASWVGLNWSLMAGGVITRSVRGLDDLDTETGNVDFPDSPELPSDSNNDYSGTESTGDLDIAQGVHIGSLDGEPDMFYFNFAGRSGKFILKKRSSTLSPYSVQVISQEKIKIEVVYTNNPGFEWTITTEDGTKYVFNTPEKTMTISDSSFGDSNSDPGGDPKTIISSWYLNDIISPTGATIHFSYTSPSTGGTRRELSKTQTRTHLIYEQSPTSCSPEFGPYGIMYHRSLSIVYDVYLQEITFNEGKIDFILEDRTDMQPYQPNPSYTTTTPKRLKEIEISAVSGNSYSLLKTYQLNYSYFNNSSSSYSDKRLQLLSVVEESNSVGKPPYSFEYTPSGISGLDLPAKNSKSRDHWGFFNGKSNENIYDIHASGNYSSTLIPPAYEYNVYTGQNVFYAGANREPDSLYMKAGVLNKITYPTGGSTTFEYEPNDYTNFPTEYVKVPHTSYLEAAGELISSPELSGPDSIIITLTVPTLLTIQATPYYDPGYNCTSESPQSVFVAQITTGVYDTFVDAVSAVIDCPTGQVGNLAKVYQPGTYKIKALAEGHWYSTVTVSWEETTSQQLWSKIGGGIRVRKATDYDGVNHGNDIIKQYKYTMDIYGNEGEGRSSGYLMAPLRYRYYETRAQLNGECGIGLASALVLTRTSDSNIPLGSSANGNHIGYNYVTVLHGDNGKSVHRFNNAVETASYWPNMPNSIPAGNGLIIGTTDYKKTGTNTYQKIREISKTYVNEPSLAINIKGLKIWGQADPDNQFDWPQVKFYNNLSEWWHPAQDIEKIYDEASDSQYVQTITDYHYDNPEHYQLTKIVTTRSDGSVDITEYKYPADYTGISTGIIGAMKGTHHMHNAVIEKVVKKERSSVEKVTGATFTAYGDADGNTGDGIGYIVPAAVYELEITEPQSGFTSSISSGTAADGSYTLRREMKYDPLVVNPVEVKETNNLATVYLWGYGGQYPIAEIRNADYATVVSTLGGSTAVSSFRDDPDPTDNEVNTFLSSLRSSLPTALVTTYTYKPLVGVTSQTDAKGMTTYYEYDTFQRLKQVKDHYGRIVKSYDYHYKQ